MDEELIDEVENARLLSHRKEVTDKYLENQQTVQEIVPSGQRLVPIERAKYVAFSFLEKLVIDAYEKDPVYTYKKLANAGVKIDQKTVNKILASPLVQRVLDFRIAEGIKQPTDLIANEKELKMFWTQIMRDPFISPMQRLAASRLLGEAEGMFVKKVEVTETKEKRVHKVIEKTLKEVYSVED